MQFALIKYFMPLMSVLNEVEIALLKLFKLATIPLFLPVVWTPGMHGPWLNLTNAYTAQTAIKPLRPIAKA